MFACGVNEDQCEEVVKRKERLSANSILSTQYLRSKSGMVREDRGCVGVVGEDRECVGVVRENRGCVGWSGRIGDVWGWSGRIGDVRRKVYYYVFDPIIANISKCHGTYSTY